MKDFWGEEINLWRLSWGVVTAIFLLGMIYSEELRLDYSESKYLKYLAIATALIGQADTLYKWVKKRKRVVENQDVIDNDI